MENYVRTLIYDDKSLTVENRGEVQAGEGGSFVCKPATKAAKKSCVRHQSG
jgi:hypothetical protein